MDTARKRAQGRLGIGLTLVRRLVELHGGQIGARSNGPGTGSEFTVRLPLAADAPEILTPIHNLGSESDFSSRPLRILVVDDNADSADSLALLLRAEGHDVRTMYDGAAALEISCSFNPEVTLQDIGMPGMNGLEVARKLREFPHTRDAILIALTGYGSGEAEEEAYSLASAITLSSQSISMRYTGCSDRLANHRLRCQLAGDANPRSERYCDCRANLGTVTKPGLGSLTRAKCRA